MAAVIRSRDDMEREGLDQAEILAASGGQLPVHFVNVTFDHERFGARDLAAWEQEFDLRLLGEDVSGTR